MEIIKVNSLFNRVEDISIESYLALNGITDIDEYLKPTGKYLESPMLYDNIVEAVQAFKYHYLQLDKAYILSDSGDSDGILSTVELYRYMKLLNKKWNIKILIHNGKQRGLDDEELFNKCVNEPRPLLIIPDAGTNDREQVKILTELGTTVIVLDHHNLTTPIEHGILINDQVGNVDKCGSGAMVTHHFMRALDLEFNVKYSSQFVDLASLSIMSDGMDTRSMQNRTYMYYGIMGGLKRIQNNFLRLMITELLPEGYLQKDINFTLVPKINSICRGDDQELKQEMIKAFLGMYDKDEDMMLEILSEMRSAHTNQQNAVKKFIEDNFDDIDKSNDVIIYVSDKVPRTYSGLVAGRIKDACDNKPTIISYDYKSSDISIGSLRSDIPLQSILNDCEYVDWCKGHAGQAGIQFKKSNISDIIQYINGLKLDYNASKDVIYSCMVNCIPYELYGLFKPYNVLFDDNKLKYPLVHIKPFTIDSQDITCFKGGVIRFKVGDVTFIHFFSSNNDKAKFHIYDKMNVKLEVEIIGEPVWNEYGGRLYKQIIIARNGYEVTECKPIQFEDIF